MICFWYNTWPLIVGKYGLLTFWMKSEKENGGCWDKTARPCDLCWCLVWKHGGTFQTCNTSSLAAFPPPRLPCMFCNKAGKVPSPVSGIRRLLCVCSHLRQPHTKQTLCKNTSRNLKRTWSSLAVLISPCWHGRGFMFLM